MYCVHQAHQQTNLIVAQVHNDLWNQTPQSHYRPVNRHQSPSPSPLAHFNNRFQRAARITQSSEI